MIATYCNESIHHHHITSPCICLLSTCRNDTCNTYPPHAPPTVKKLIEAYLPTPPTRSIQSPTPNVCSRMRITRSSDAHECTMKITILRSRFTGFRQRGKRSALISYESGPRTLLIKFNQVNQINQPHVCFEPSPRLTSHLDATYALQVFPRVKTRIFA
jgi:hypothetical protein